MEDVKERGELDLTECFIDGTFVMAKEEGKGTKLIVDGVGFPIAVSVGSASPHEARLVEDTLDKLLVDEQYERLIGDRAYDSDPLDEKLVARGISLIASHKSNRKKPKTQDDRALRRYRRRWKRGTPICMVAKLSSYFGSLWAFS